MKRYAATALFAASLFASAPAAAQVDVDGYYLPMKVALKAAETAVDSCATHGWDVTATVVDPAGLVIVQLRGDQQRSTLRTRPIERPIQSSPWVRSSASRARANSSHSSRKRPTGLDQSSPTCRIFSLMREALPSSTVLKSSAALALADPRVETGTRHVLPTALQPSPTNSNKQLKSPGSSRPPHDSHSASEVIFKDSDGHTGRGEARKRIERGTPIGAPGAMPQASASNARADLLI